MGNKLAITGLFGGSFNPPHIGHVTAAMRAVEALGLDKIIIMPTGRPSHKLLPFATPLPEDRLAMARLAFEDLPHCEVSDWEISRPLPAYTADTLEYLRETGLSPILIVGSDMFLTLHEWARADQLLSLTRVAVLLRNPSQAGQVSRHAAFLAHRYGAAIDWIEHTPVEISSTELRGLLKSGKGREYLPKHVCEYICKKRLYI